MATGEYSTKQKQLELTVSNLECISDAKLENEIDSQPVII